MSEIVIQVYMPGGNAPAQIEGKFLELTLHDSEYLLFAPRGLYPYHNHILARFLNDQNIPHRWAQEDRLEFDFPALRVIGGGRFRVNVSERMLLLWDNSQAYGRFEASGLEQKIAQANHPWSEYGVKIS